MARLLEAVAMMMDDPEPLHGVLDAYREAYRNARQQAWVERLGLDVWKETDEALVRDLQHVMHASEVDHVPMLRHMAKGLTTAEALRDAGRIYAAEPDLAAINAWLGRWLERTGARRIAPPCWRPCPPSRHAIGCCNSPLTRLSAVTGPKPKHSRRA